MRVDILYCGDWFTFDQIEKFKIVNDTFFYRLGGKWSAGFALEDIETLDIVYDGSV